MIVGVDFGGVLTETTTPPESNYLDIPPRSNYIEVMSKWREIGITSILISKASEEQEPKARDWLAYWGIDKLFDGRLEFCIESEGKIAICKSYGVEAMVDDTISQLDLLVKVVPQRLLFNATEAPKDMKPAPDWLATDTLIMGLI
jgi:hypothetical protein